MINSPLFSIVIPTYKGQDSLAIALESINKQTYKKIEIIVSDDNGKGTESQLETEKIINKYKHKLDIKYIVNKHINGSHARNEGMKIANGEYVSFLDDDDFYLETFVEDAIQEFDDNGVLFFDTVVINENGVYKRISSPNINSKNLLFYKQEIGTGSNICISKSILEKGCFFDERYVRHQDIEFVAKLINKHKYKWINKVNIVKYFNNTNNYPSVNTAIEMQKLLRDDMLKNQIVNTSEYKKLESFQLHSLFKDYLAKGASNENIEETYKLLKDTNNLEIFDICMYVTNKISKVLFNKIYRMYSKKKIQEDDSKKDYYIQYREMLIKEAVEQ